MLGGGIGGTRGRLKIEKYLNGNGAQDEPKRSQLLRTSKLRSNKTVARGPTMQLYTTKSIPVAFDSILTLL